MSSRNGGIASLPCIAALLQILLLCQFVSRKRTADENSV